MDGSTELDSWCVTSDSSWSIMTSAPTNSSLAAVVAGLLIATVAVLFTRKREQHTIALFATGVVVLALDSYLFSHVAGIRARSDNPLTEPSQSDINTACEMAWIQGIPASGLLVTGAIALTCGVAWMMTSYVADSTEPEATDNRLSILAGLLVAFVTIATTLLLGSTAHQYLQVLTENLDPNVTKAQIELESLRLKHLGSQTDGSMTLKQLVLPQVPSGSPELRDDATPSKLGTHVLWIIGGVVLFTWALSLSAIYRSTFRMQAAIKNRTGTDKIELKTPSFMFWAIAIAVVYVAVGPGFAGFYSLGVGGGFGYIIAGLIIGAVYPLVVAVLLCCSLPRPKPPPKPSTTRPPRARQNTSSGAVVMALLLVIANTWRK